MRRIVGAGLLVASWLALFIVPSAVAIGRGAPGWLATAIGGSFVAAVLGWHAWGERKRKPGTLTGWDRLAIRTVVVAIAAGGAAWLVAKPSLPQAVRHHWRWMIPRSTSGLVAEGKLLEQVPASAEAVLWIRDASSRALGAFLSEVPQLADVVREHYELVVAGATSGDALLAIDASSEVEDAFARLMEWPREYLHLPAPHLTELGDAKLWSSDDWVSQLDKGRPSALFALFDQAPTDADLVFAARAAKPSPKDPISAIGWLRVDGDVADASVELVAATPGAAAAFEAELRRDVDKQHGCVPDDLLTIGRAGAALHIGVHLERDAIVAMFRCLDRTP